MNSSRSTRQKRALSQLLGELDSFRSAQDLFLELRSRGEHVGLATVYNQLRTLSEAGDVDVIRTGDGESLYRRCGRGHHHHLTCRQCGKTVEIEQPELETLAMRLASAHQFSDVTHTFEIVGLCPSCKEEIGET